MQDEDTQETEDIPYSLTSAAVPAALVPTQIESTSADDPTLKLVRQAVRTGDWSQMSGTIYKAIKDQLWVEGQAVMIETRIVMPQSLWRQTIMLAHEGHRGMVRTKARLREKVWWPQMDKQVEDTIRAAIPASSQDQDQNLNLWGRAAYPKGPGKKSHLTFLRYQMVKNSSWWWTIFLVGWRPLS